MEPSTPFRWHRSVTRTISKPWSRQRCAVATTGDGSGIDLKEALSQRFERFIHPVATGEPWDIQARVATADGSYHWFLARAGGVPSVRASGRERRIAAAMQEASLPRTLPTIENLPLSAEFRPGSSEATIGGDWYDAFLLSDGRLALTIGDDESHVETRAIAHELVERVPRGAPAADDIAVLVGEIRST